MRAIILATGESPALNPLIQRYPTPLLPLVDRPFIQHVIEFIIDQGVLEFDFILCHLPEKIEQHLGDGTRWGSTFRFHLARNASHACKRLKEIVTADNTRPLLVGCADRLPGVQFRTNRPPVGSDAVVAYCWRQATPQKQGPSLWTGWAWLSARFIGTLPDGFDESALATQLLAVTPEEGVVVDVPLLLDVRTYDGLMSAHHKVLAKEFQGLLLTGREAAESIWLSRNVTLHPTARLQPPVFIGENCQIAAGVQLGPHVTVGPNCIIDRRCIVSDSIIFPGSYLGETLELSNAIVDKNCLVNVRIGAAVSIVDNFILGSIGDNPVRRWVGSLFVRLIGTMLLVLFLPLLLATGLWLKMRRSGPVLHRWEVLRLPTSAQESEWRTYYLWSFYPEGLWHRRLGLSDFFLCFLPALINIARGELRFVGVAPRTKEAVRALPTDWQALYLRSKAGIVTEAYVLYGPSPTDDELYSAESYYSATAGLRHDIRLLLRYFARILNPFAACRERRLQVSES